MEIAKFKVLDKDGDGFLDRTELPGAIFPELSDESLHLMGRHTLKEKDADGDQGYMSNQVSRAIPHLICTEEYGEIYKKLDTINAGVVK